MMADEWFSFTCDDHSRNEDGPDFDTSAYTDCDLFDGDTGVECAACGGAETA
jgi:hypothetical protein